MNEWCNPNLNILKKHLSRPGMANHLLVAHANWYVVNTHSSMLRKSLRTCLSWQQREMWSVSSIYQKYEWWSSITCACTYPFGFKLMRQATKAWCRGHGLHKLGGKPERLQAAFSSSHCPKINISAHLPSAEVQTEIQKQCWGTTQTERVQLGPVTRLPVNSLLVMSFPFRPLNSSSTSSCFTFGKWPTLPHPQPPSFLSCSSH